MNELSPDDLAMATQFSDELGVIQYRMHACCLLEDQLSCFIRLSDKRDSYIIRKLTKEKILACNTWSTLKRKETDCFAKIIEYKKDPLFLYRIVKSADEYVHSLGDREIFKFFPLSIREDNTPVIESLLQF